MEAALKEAKAGLVKKTALAAPTAGTAAGEVSRGTANTLTVATEVPEGTEVKIYYTIDGSEPTLESDLYNGAITINEDVVIKAFATAEDYKDSDVVTLVYTIKKNEEAPVQDWGDILEEDIPADGIIPEGLWIAGVDEAGYEYTGKDIKPQIRVYDNKKLLVEKTDYTVSYKNNKNVWNGVEGKQPVVIIKGKGKYNGTETETFVINLENKNAGDRT